MRTVPQNEQFRRACEEIGRAYESMGHKLGWRFLTGPSSTFFELQEILLLTLNPAGDRDYPEHPRASCESGSAYIVESWDDRPAGEAGLQKQIRLLFAELAKFVNGMSGDDLLSTSLSAHFVPFRSPSFDTLHEREGSLSFAKGLWSRVMGHISPKIVIVLSREAFDNMLEIESELQASSPIIDDLPVGWGRYNATVARFTGGPVICRFPHLSRFAVFGRPQSAAHIRRIMDLLAAHYRSNRACESNEKRRSDPDSSSRPNSDISAVTRMKNIYVIAQPSKPFRSGTARYRAWLLLQAFDGLSVEKFVKACGLMERASRTGGDPEGWVKFFTATGRYHDRPGNPNASEKLAEVR